MREMIDKKCPSLSVGTQCRLPSISRSSFYYELMVETVMNFDFMVVIVKQFLETPFYGIQQTTWHLRNGGAYRELQAHSSIDAAQALDPDLSEARYQ